jgi:ribosomal protein L12E/L44/L45/RPP1/RPP2
MDFKDLLKEDSRLVILRSLNEDAGFDLNESVLQSVLAALGHNMSRDKIRTELAWLQEQGLISLHTVVGVQVATLSARGADVATGAATVPGVKRPRPRD